MEIKVEISLGNLLDNEKVKRCFGFMKQVSRYLIGRLEDLCDLCD